MYQCTDWTSFLTNANITHFASKNCCKDDNAIEMIIVDKIEGNKYRVEIHFQTGKPNFIAEVDALDKNERILDCRPPRRARAFSGPGMAVSHGCPVKKNEELGNTHSNGTYPNAYLPGDVETAAIRQMLGDKAPEELLVITAGSNDVVSTFRFSPSLSEKKIRNAYRPDPSVCPPIDVLVEEKRGLGVTEIRDR